MPEGRTVVIANPAAAAGRVGRALPRLSRALWAAPVSSTTRARRSSASSSTSSPSAWAVSWTASSTRRRSTWADAPRSSPGARDHHPLRLQRPLRRRGMRFAPDALLDDGLFEVLCVEHRSLPPLLAVPAPACVDRGCAGGGPRYRWRGARAAASHRRASAPGAAPVGRPPGGPVFSRRPGVRRARRWHDSARARRAPATAGRSPARAGGAPAWGPSPATGGCRA